MNVAFLVRKLLDHDYFWGRNIRWAIEGAHCLSERIGSEVSKIRLFELRTVFKSHLGIRRAN